MFHQGKKFKKYQNKYNNLVKNRNLQDVSIGKLNVVNNLRYRFYHFHQSREQ